MTEVSDSINQNDPFNLERFVSAQSKELKSSMTLFAAVQSLEPAFARVLDKYFQGKQDITTIELLNQHP